MRERCVRAGTARPVVPAILKKKKKTFFFKGKKSLKESAMLLSWQHCASPSLQLRVGPRVKQKIHAALIVR